MQSHSSTPQIIVMLPVRNVAELETAVASARRGSYLRFYVQRFDPRSGRSGQFFAFARVP